MILTPLVLRRRRRRLCRLRKPVWSPDFTAGWDLHSFKRRDCRRYAISWIRYLQSLPLLRTGYM